MLKRWVSLISVGSIDNWHRPGVVCWLPLWYVFGIEGRQLLILPLSKISEADQVRFCILYQDSILIYYFSRKWCTTEPGPDTTSLDDTPDIPHRNWNYVLCPRSTKAGTRSGPRYLSSGFETSTCARNSPKYLYPAHPPLGEVIHW